MMGGYDLMARKAWIGSATVINPYNYDDGWIDCGKIITLKEALDELKGVPDEN